MFDRIKAWAAARYKQVSTWVGAGIGVAALSWPAVAQSAPAAIQQLQQTNPALANAVNVGFVVLGAVLVHWNPDKAKADGQ